MPSRRRELFNQRFPKYLLNKGKTLELFGTEYENGSFHPFHIYSMRQAIEEGFILNVLQNYMTYDTCFKIAKTVPDNPDVPASSAAKLIRRYQETYLQQEVNVDLIYQT